MAEQYNKSWEINLGDGAAPGATLVTSVSSEIVASNRDRNWIILTNIGASDVWISFGQTAEVEKGMLLGAGGGSMAMDKTFITTDAINGRTTTGESKVIYQEGS